MEKQQFTAQEEEKTLIEIYTDGKRQKEDFLTDALIAIVK